MYVGLVKDCILLINVPTEALFADCPSDASEENIGLGYIAAYLKHAGLNDVILMDAVSRRLSEKCILREVYKLKPGFVCLSPTFATWDLTLKIIRNVKLVNPSTIIILGGPHVSFEPILSRAFNMENGIDFIVSGEGEIATFKIITQSRLGKVSTIPGVSYRQKDSVFIAKGMAEYVENLDGLPFPMRDKAALREKALRITTSRGCYRHSAGCTFCPTPSLYHDGWRGRSAVNVVDEMEVLNRQGFDTFICAESDFIGVSVGGLQRAYSIADEILKRNMKIRLRIFAGVPQILWAERVGLWNKLKQAGLERVYPGIESSDPDTLELFNKHQDVVKMYRALNILKRAGMASQIGFIMFNPWSTCNSVKKNCTFLDNVNQAHLWHNFASSLLLLPGAKILKIAENDGLIKRDIKQVALGNAFVLNYNYVKEEMASLVEWCTEIMENKVVRNINRVMITSEIVASRVGRIGNPRGKELAYVSRYNSMRERISKNNIKIFSKMVNTVERNYQEKEKRNIIARHLENIESIYQELEDGLKEGKQIVMGLKVHSNAVEV